MKGILRGAWRTGSKIVRQTEPFFGECGRSCLEV